MRVCLLDYDPAWPEFFAREVARIRRVLGAAALSIEHVGSTSIPGLAAKPVIDIVIEVKDSRDESAYVPPLESCGYRFHLREPQWWEHRLLKRSGPDVNLHIFTAGGPEVLRMVRFRDHLRACTIDRLRYEWLKRELASCEWASLQDYADAKTTVIEEILVKASASPG